MTYFPAARFTALARRDFFRDAALGLMIPLLAALSIALYAVESDWRADAASVVIVFLTDLTVSVRARLRRTLNTCFLREARCAFFAEVVIAMCPHTTTRASFLQAKRLWYYIRNDTPGDRYRRFH